MHATAMRLATATAIGAAALGITGAATADASNYKPPAPVSNYRAPDVETQTTTSTRFTNSYRSNYSIGAHQVSGGSWSQITPGHRAPSGTGYLRVYSGTKACYQSGVRPGWTCKTAGTYRVIVTRTYVVTAS